VWCIIRFKKTFKDLEAQKAIKEVQIQLILAVSLAQYLKTDPQLNGICVSQIKSLIFSVHQNYLLFCDLIYKKLSTASSYNVFFGNNFE